VTEDINLEEQEWRLNEMGGRERQEEDALLTIEDKLSQSAATTVEIKARQGFRIGVAGMVLDVHLQHRCLKWPLKQAKTDICLACSGFCR
jgi:hypothetical protein